MTDMLDFRREAQGCLRLAESEAQSEMKTILMGMALGWLTFASESQAFSDDQHVPTDEPVEEPIEEPIHEPVEASA